MSHYDVLVVLHNPDASDLVKVCIHYISRLCGLPRFHVFQGVETTFSKAVQHFGASRMRYSLAVVECTESVTHLSVIIDELEACGMICPILVVFSNTSGKTDDSPSTEQTAMDFLYKGHNLLRTYTTLIHANMTHSVLQHTIQRCLFAQELQIVHAYGGVSQQEAVILSHTPSHSTLGCGLSSICRAVLQPNGKLVTFLQVNSGFVSRFGFDLCDLYGKDLCCLGGPATEDETMKRLESAVINHEDFCAFVVLYDSQADAHVQFAVVRPLGCKDKSKGPPICLLSLGHPSVVGAMHSSWVIDQIIPQQDSELDQEQHYKKTLKL